MADLLRGDYKQSESGRVILPLTGLRRLDCVLEPTKEKVLAQAAKYGDRAGAEQILSKAAGEQFYNTSKYDFARLLAAPDDLADDLRRYIASFSPADLRLARAGGARGSARVVLLSQQGRRPADLPASVGRPAVGVLLTHPSCPPPSPVPSGIAFRSR